MHRLFHSLVVCGAGLTIVQCGGQSTSDRDEPNPEQGGGMDASSGTGSGGAGNSGGVSSGGLGGSAGSIDTGAAGASNSGSKPDGPTEQWTCNTSNLWCDTSQFGGVVPLDDAFCVREQTRPATLASCDPGFIFTCTAGVLDGEPVHFSCECAVLPEIDAPCPCPPGQGDCDTPTSPATCTDESFCHCAMTCILR